ncbi:hypothetical protein COU37_00105 [Candidatus Micrarchaeota archaeon CG10_big_fil_rev_8_21_14_0_10_45_29]|nr:MAG: hypothetical protein COU37_00105 [Candidatus Micrarchaeota archaeon CG10_big_fil_rev_8_21_14_0_10_45_29]
MQQKQSFAIVGGQVLRGNGFNRADVLVENGLIKGIGNYRSTQNKIDAASCFVLPGFINTHAHLGETIFRDAVKFSNLNDYIEKTEKINALLSGKSKLLREISGSNTMLEFIHSGITTICAGRCAQECESAGLRSFSGYMLMQSKKLQKYFTNFESEFKNFITEINNTLLSKPFLFLHSLTYSTSGMINLARRLIQERGIPLMVHVAETLEEETRVKEETGVSSVKFLENNGLITNSTLLVHCCNISDKDMGIIKRRGATIVLCPTSNVRLNNQIPPFDKMLKQGINLCIATDGLATALSKNILCECLFLKKEFKRVESFNWMNLITTNPARSLGIRSGSMYEGSSADIVIFGPDKAANAKKIKRDDIIDFVSMLEVRDVICAGKEVMRNGEVTTIDEKKIHASFNALNRSIKDLETQA